MKSSSKSTLMISSHTKKKNKVNWTKDLHNKFLKAIDQLGVDNAVPKKILSLMKVKGLTRDHVASHLQKYRALLKKIADENYEFQITSKPVLLESSTMTHGNISQTNQPKQEQTMWPSYTETHLLSPPILDTSSSYIYVLESSRFNPVASLSQNAEHSVSLPNQGYYTNAIDEQWSMIDDVTKLGVVDSSEVKSVEFSNFGVVENHDGYNYAYGGGSSNVNPYNNITEMGSSGGEYSNNESAARSWNHDNLTNTRNINGVESNKSSENKNVEMGSLYDFMNLDCNLEYEIGEDDPMLHEDMVSLLSYVNHDAAYESISNNQAITLNPQNRKHNEDHVNENQTSDEYGFDPTFNMQPVEQLMEPIWSPEPFTNYMTSNAYI